MKLYPNVQCTICEEYVDPAAAYWITGEWCNFDNDGRPERITSMEPVCEDCTLRVLLDKDTPRHELRRPRPPDSK